MDEFTDETLLRLAEKVVAREGGVTTLLALVTDQGVDAACLPLAMSVLDNTAAAAPEASAKQVPTSKHSPLLHRCSTR